MHKAKRAGLEGAEDWDMQEGLQAGKTWGTSIGTGKVETENQLIESSTALLSGAVSPRRKYIS